jgi:hypothetical protein
VTLEAELERIAGAAGAHARAGEELAAVMPAEPAPGVRVYLTAYRAGEELGYLVLDAGGAPVTDRRLVRDAVSVLALAERAEEASAAVAAEPIADSFEAAAGALAGADAGAAAAARAVAEAARELAATAEGLRLATPAYLDRLAAAAGALTAALDAYAVQAERLAETGGERGAGSEVARAAWGALAEVGRHADPASFGPSMNAGTAAVEALADDVLARYRVPLSGRG